MYYPCSENKGADTGSFEVTAKLFSHMQIVGFLNFCVCLQCKVRCNVNCGILFCLADHIFLHVAHRTKSYKKIHVIG